MHQGDPEAYEGGPFFESAEGIGLVLLTEYPPVFHTCFAFCLQ